MDGLFWQRRFVDRRLAGRHATLRHSERHRQQFYQRNPRDSVHRRHALLDRSALSADYFATGLVPNPGPTVTEISTPYNDSGDKYHVVIDFSGTTGGPNPGVLPAGSIFALIDLDSTENYRQITATNAANAVINTPWIGGPNAYFDMNNPLTPVAFMVPPPILAGPVAGVYQMFGPSGNYDVGMWLFNTTQDVKTISFNMELGIQGGPFQGGGGAAWAFYTTKIPEPASFSLLAIGLCCFAKRANRRC